MKKIGFTLAEVLMTLGIIGIVAAMTIPTLVSDFQKRALAGQFKKSYANMTQVLKLAIVDMGYQPRCGYWPSNESPYADLNVEVTVNPDTGEKSWHQIVDGEQVSLPSGYNGPMTHCSALSRAMLKRLKIVKECKGNGVANGCIASPGYEGNDTLAKIMDPELSDIDAITATSGNGGFRKNNLNNNNHIILLADGSAIVSYGTQFSPQVFAIDVNGLKGPNKWGYDLFSFNLKYTSKLQDRLFVGQGGPVDVGGTSALTMVNNIKKNPKK